MGETGLLSPHWAFGIVTIFSFGSTNECEVAYHCGLNIHFYIFLLIDFRERGLGRERNTDF